jgi:hypothetical protein
VIRRTQSLLLCWVALLGSCSDTPSKVYEAWSPHHINRVRVEQGEYGGGAGAESFDVYLLDGGDASQLVSVHSYLENFSLIWVDDYHLVVRACHGNVLSLKSNDILAKSLSSNDYTHTVFYTQPVTIKGVTVDGREVCPEQT